MGDLRRSLQAELARSLGSSAEARWIVEEALGPPGRLGGDQPAVSARAIASARALAARRLAGEPLQYVLGHWAFRWLDLLVDPRVLIPRPETEQVVEVALTELVRVAGSRADPVVVDLGTGSGAVALAVAAEARRTHPGISVWATDDDRGALEVAAANRDRVGAADPATAERVRLRRGDWFGALPGELRGRVDLVVANPPYVALEEWDDLAPEVRCEPVHALVAGTGADGTPGLGAVEAVLHGAAEWLARPGTAVVEIAPHQAVAAADVAGRAGFGDVLVRLDLAGLERVVVARR
ncbi:MAG TPA: peptide chain release factor N(5)-glutamine methyltransferase [Acidimicrobiales bacterium]|nr:peptide chain release factor N(5)-glutamine methyltransferase [Acidimicrobiales bacterium]